MDLRSIALPIVALLLSLAAGCGTSRFSDTQRTGLEQLLISTAIDRSLGVMDFSGLAGQAVYVEQKHLDCVDKNYLLASIRHRALQAGARLVDKPEEADLVLEVRHGGVGTDRMEAYVGAPGITLPSPVPISLPDLKIATRASQSGTAKLGIVVYHAKTGQAAGSGGSALARSVDSNWTILGVGPFNSGSVRQEFDAAKVALESQLGIELASRPRWEPVPDVTIGPVDVPATPPGPLPVPSGAVEPQGSTGWFR